jgi:hypothetical protein
MSEEIKKPIASVTINYQDGSHDKMDYYALVGLGGDTWYKVMLSPAKTSAKIKMNNMIAELCNSLIDTINKEQGEAP